MCRRPAPVLDALILVLIALVWLAACTPHPVGPARSYASYEGKAVTTAQSALSAVATVRLAAEAGSDGHAFGPYLSVSISDQEESISGLQGTFASIQPPDEQADRLRTELDGLLGDAVSHVADVRIAARRGEIRALDEVARPLAGDADALTAFIEAHGS